MSAAHEPVFGPYTAEDLHDLPDEGKRFELVDGWLIELSPGTPHNQVVDALYRTLMSAASADLYVTSEPDVATPAGVRRPDVAVLDKAAALASARLRRSAYYGADVLLVVEVVSRGSASEREDRTRKLTDYAQAGIPQYWIVDFEPAARVQVLRLEDDVYRVAGTVDEGQVLKVDVPLNVAIDLRDLVAWRRAEG